MEELTGLGDIPLVSQDTSKHAGTGMDADKLKLDFLKLLVAQLQYQDPLEPTSNTEFTSQMAQFSTLDAQQESNQLLQQLLDSQNPNQINQAVSFIGKRVVVSGNQTTMEDSAGTVRFRASDAGIANIRLFKDGEPVKEVGPVFLPAGEGSVPIDGSGADGTTALQDGAYTFTIQMVGSDGDPIDVTPLQASQVTGVVNDASGVTLDLNGLMIPLASVHRVEQGSG